MQIKRNISVIPGVFERIVYTMRRHRYVYEVTRMIDHELFKKVYQQSNEMTVDDCKDLLSEASSPEEERFYVGLRDIILQNRQKQLILNEKY